jgi:dCMP deaminase
MPCEPVYRHSDGGACDNASLCKKPHLKQLLIVERELRIDRDELWMSIAKVFALRSTCNRGRVGAVIVQGRHIVSHGYNGAPACMPHCTDVGCAVAQCNCPYNPATYPDHTSDCATQLGCQRTVHAEANAIAWAARFGVTVESGIMYSTHEPCHKCAQLIISCGIAECYWDQPYRLGAGRLLNQANILGGLIG